MSYTTPLEYVKCSNEKMTHRKQDTTGLEVLQGAIGEGDDGIRMLLQHTVQQVLEEEIASFF